MEKVTPQIKEFYARMKKTVTQKTMLTEAEQETMLKEIKGMIDSYSSELNRMSTIVISQEEQEPFRTEMIAELIADRDRKINDLLNLNEEALKQGTDRRIIERLIN